MDVEFADWAFRKAQERLLDPPDDTPAFTCDICGGEIYGGDAMIDTGKYKVHDERECIREALLAHGGQAYEFASDAKEAG